MTTILTCHFLFALRQAERTTAPSSPSEVPSLNFASAASRSGLSSHETLPAFIASMGSEVNTGLHFVDSAGTDLDGARSREATSREGDSAQEDEGEVEVANMLVEQAEKV